METTAADRSDDTEFVFVLDENFVVGPPQRDSER